MNHLKCAARIFDPASAATTCTTTQNTREETMKSMPAGNTAIRNIHAMHRVRGVLEEDRP